MNYQPTFFVVTPILNRIETIDRTIGSVIGQRGDFRIRYHVQDGGSTDGTIEQLRQWSRKIENSSDLVRCQDVEFSWASAPDRGMYDALEVGLDMLPAGANDILTWINGDDVILPFAFNTVARVLDAQPDMQWLGGAVRVIDEGDRVVEESDMLSPTEVIREGLCDGWHWNHLQQEGMFFKKSLWFKSKHALNGFKLAGDWSLWREFSRHAEFHQVSFPLGAFRSRPGQLSIGGKVEYEAEIQAVLTRDIRRMAFDKLYARRSTLRCSRIDPAFSSTELTWSMQETGVFFDRALKKIQG